MNVVVDEAMVERLADLLQPKVAPQRKAMIFCRGFARNILTELSKDYAIVPQAVLAKLRNMRVPEQIAGLDCGILGCLKDESYKVGYNDALMDVLAILKEVPSDV